MIILKVVWGVTNGSSNLKGSIVEIVLEGPWKLVLKQFLCFSFHARNNQVEYEAMIFNLRLAKEVKVVHLVVHTDS